MTSESDYLEAPGEPVDPPLAINKARDLAEFLQLEMCEFAQFVECRKTAKGEVVVFDVEVELGQLKANDIRRTERLSAEFYSDDSIMPEVLALRADFPSVPHLNLRHEEFPRSLCLYDQPYRELKRQWTAARFVERVRWWLARTAKGKLHGEDQPLEPLLLSHAGSIVLPYSMTTAEPVEQCRVLFITATSLKAGDAFFIATTARPQEATPGVPSAACVFSCDPQVHGVIRHQPRTIAELSQLVAPAGLDLLAELRTELKKSQAELGEHAGAFLDAPLIIIVRFPKTRSPDGAVESTDVSVFLTFQSVCDVGVDIGAWSLFEGQLGAVLEPTEDQTGSNIEINVLDPVYELNPTWAALLNGHRPGKAPPIAAIGAGALGSQVIMNSARAGFGATWTVIDEDRLCPHNLTRHALDGAHVGYQKAEMICLLANSLTPSTERFSPIVADVLRPNEKSEETAKALGEADTILDMSASVSVARHIVHAVDSKAQRISLFLNPTGDDLVLLAESKKRSIPLDALEMQYYRALVTESALAGHFDPQDDRHRYGQSCRDVTATIAQESVGLHAAIGARAVRTACESDEPQITVWRSTPEHTVTRIDVQPTPITRTELGDWTLIVDGHVLDRLCKSRIEKLPKETGGVLLGSFDLERKIAYIADTIPSPPDSVEWPDLYIRGCKGLKRQVTSIHDRTDGMLHYVGEWHTHPDGCSTLPSEDDVKVFAWLTERMDADGYPALMMIAGEGGAVNVFIGKMDRRENLIPLPEC